MVDRRYLRLIGEGDAVELIARECNERHPRS
jgi:hypothetical protein